MSEHSAKAIARAKKLIGDLQNVTPENGATEEEALNAAKRLGELLDKYNLDMSDASIREDTGHCIKNEVFAADDYAGTLVVGIKHFCGIIAYTVTNDGHAGKYVFFGVEHDVAIALYLYEICAEAMDHDWSAFMEVHGYSMKKRASFRAGFATRVYDRLMQLKAERDAKMSSARDLIVLKDQLVTEQFTKQLGIRLVKSKAKNHGAADPNAYRAGHAAGGRVNLNNPLEGASNRNASIR
jgi:hypothetical protein